MAANDDLPGVLAEIAELTNREAAIQMAYAYGGSTLHIPSPDRVWGHGLSALVGHPSAVKITERFQGEQVYVPKARRAVAIWLRSLGLSTRQISEKLGVTQRAARRMVA